VTTLTATRAAELPRVNLLPPEIAAAARLGRLKKVLVALVLATVVLGVLLFVWAGRQVGAAQEQLDVANASNQQLQAQAAQYAQVPEVASQVVTAQTQLAVAMAPEVRVSFVMNDLSLTIPSSVRLSGMTIGIGPSDPTLQAAAAAATSAGVAAPTAAGSVAYTGKATSYDAVASWLVSFNRQVDYTDIYLSNIIKDTDATTVGKTYSFTSSAALSEDAKSNRYSVKTGQ
jgi:Tfp pilus assembly protein PilN